MRRMSARYFGIEMGKSTEWIYSIWKEMGLIAKDKGDWKLTGYGSSVGGRMSKSNYCPVPTFKFEEIAPEMIEFYERSVES